MSMKILSKKTMMMMMIVKVVLFLLLSIGLVFSASSVASTEDNIDIHDYRHEQTGMNVVDRRGGDIDNDSDILMNDVMMMKPHESSSSLLHQRMMMKEHQIMKSKNHLMNGNSIITTEQNHHNEQRLLQLVEIMKQNDIDDLELSFHERMTMITRNGTTSTKGCIKTQTQLEAAIMNVPDNLLVPTNINICEKMIIRASIPNSITGERGIHIINKFINIRCILKNNKKCIISARGMSRHFHIMNSTLVLNRMSFIQGKEISSDAFKPSYGGSLLLTSSSKIVVQNCNFIGNAVVQGVSTQSYNNLGGAIHCDYDTNIKLVNVNMISNDANNNGNTDGGYGSAINTWGNMQMTNVLFRNNYGIYGAANSWYGNVEMINVSFINNTGNSGGGYSGGNGGNVNMVNVSFINNTAITYGGAITLYNAIVKLVNCTMINNYAGYFGGAIALGDDINAEITNSLFHRNSAALYGGAVLSYGGITLYSDTVMTDNSSPIFAVINSKVGLKKIKCSNIFLNDDDCDFRIGSSIYGEEGFFSRVNLLPSSPLLLLQETPTNLQVCVSTFTALRDEVRLCSNTCVLNICQSGIQMNNSINLSNKNIFFNCQENSSIRCMIDGQGLSRMFSGSNVNVTFRNMIFANGYSPVSGGVIDMDTSSFVNLFNCTFLNNSAAAGGAVMIKDTILYMTGTQSSFINNTGNRPPLTGYSSKLNINDVLFEGNGMTEYGNSILLYDSSFDFYNATFPKSKNLLDFDCNVYVAIYPDNLTDGASCLDTSNVY